MVMSDATSRTLEARDAVAELRTACDWACSSPTTVVRQSTQVPKTSIKSARGVGFKAIVMPAMSLGGVLGTGTGVGDVRSFCTGLWGNPAMRGGYVRVPRIGKARAQRICSTIEIRRAA